MRVRVRRFLVSVVICSLLPAMLPLQALQARPLWDDGGSARCVSLPPPPAQPSRPLPQPGLPGWIQNVINPVRQIVQNIVAPPSSARQTSSPSQHPSPPPDQSIKQTSPTQGPASPPSSQETKPAGSPPTNYSSPSGWGNATIPAGPKITIAGTSVQFTKPVPEPVNVTKHMVTATSLGDGFAKAWQSGSAEDAGRTALSFGPQPYRIVKDLSPDSYNATTNTFYYDTDRITGKTAKYLARALIGESDNKVLRAVDDALLRDPGDFLWGDDLFRKNRKPPGQSNPPEEKPPSVSPVAHNQTRTNPQPSGVSDQLTAATPAPTPPPPAPAQHPSRVSNQVTAAAAVATVTAVATGTAAAVEKAAGAFKPGPTLIVNIVAIPFYRNLLAISGYKGERMSNQVVY